MEEDWNIVLSVLESPNSAEIGYQKVFTTSPITIGRAEDNDFILSDPTVSRHHAILRITNDYSRVFITDSSSHGTFVSDKKVPPGLGSGFTIADGDNIRVGNSLIRFELNLKQSVQSTFVGQVDRSFLDKPPEEMKKSGEQNAVPVSAEMLSVPEEEGTTFNPVYIGVIIVCVLILVYLIFFQ